MNNNIQSESDNIKISKLIRLSRKRRHKQLKKTHKSNMIGGKRTSSNSQVKKKNSQIKTSKSQLESEEELPATMEIECEVISYGTIKYLLDKDNNIYSFPDQNEQYYFVGKKVNDYSKFDKDYQHMIDSKKSSH